jgi:hypothetical protein
VISLGLLQNTTGDLICLIYAWTTSEALSLLMVVLYIWEQWLDIQRTENCSYHKDNGTKHSRAVFKPGNLQHHF